MGLAPALLQGFWYCENPECPLHGDAHEICVTGSIVEVSMIITQWGYSQDNASLDPKTGVVTFTDERGSYLTLRPAMDAASLITSAMGPPPF